MSGIAGLGAGAQPPSESPAGGPEEVLPGLWRLVLPMAPGDPRTANAYLVRDAESNLLVDSGFGSEAGWAALTEQLAPLGLDSSAVRTALVTHAHPDHYGLAERLRAAGAQVWLHAADEDFARRRHADRPAYRALLIGWLERYGFPAAEAAEMAAAFEAIADSGPPRVERLLQGGEELAAGPYRFAVLRTPGHTPGHVCLYEASQRLLVCGDHLLEHSNPNVGLQPTSTDNPMAGYLDSLRQLGGLELDLALPGHGAPFRGLPGLVERTLRHQLDRRARLLELLTARPQTAYELAGQVWASSRRWSWDRLGRRRRNAVATLAAHLELLAAEGAIGRLEDDQVRFFRAT